jgi:small subunit ribosomal protein S20
LAHSLSAAKRHRQSLKLRDRNKGNQTAAKSAVRKARELVAAGKGDEAIEAVRQASSILDRAAQKGALHKNNASRRKARLARMLNTGVQEKAAPAKKRAAGTRSRAKKS